MTAEQDNGGERASDMDILLVLGSLAGLACYVVWHIGTQKLRSVTTS
jgi:hypothetical protein